MSAHHELSQLQKAVMRLRIEPGGSTIAPERPEWAHPSPLLLAPAKARRPNPERPLSLWPWELIFIPFGDLCRLFAHLAGERQPKTGAQAAPNNRSGGA
jgi:hypothetical protein